MKIGDKVRFLNEIGGGRVAGFQGKNQVLVEDEDGFQVPMLMSDVVVVGDESYDTGRIVAAKQQGKTAQRDVPAETEPADKPITFKKQPEERRGGEKLSAYLAFVPYDVKELSQTRFETYFVNDSNYYLRFAYYSAEGSSWQLRATDEVEPNTKVFVEEIGRENLDELEHVALQLMAYKRGKPFCPEAHRRRAAARGRREVLQAAHVPGERLLRAAGPDIHAGGGRQGGPSAGGERAAAEGGDVCQA